MNLECPQCSSPISQEGQRFCNRCGVDLRGFYEARGTSLPSNSVDAPPAPAEADKAEMATLEMQLPGASNAAPNAVSTPLPNSNSNAEKNPAAKPGNTVDPNHVEPQPISHTIAIEMPDITVETVPANDSTSQKAMLRILLPSSDVFDREIRKVETQIGKGPRNDIVLADPAVSTSHAVIRQENSGYLLKDLGSRNGTMLNGKKISAAEKLNHGDVIGMGTTKLTFRLGSHSETTVFETPDLTLPIPNRLPVMEDSLAIVFVRDAITSQSNIDNMRGPGAKGRRLLRALAEEGLANEEAMRDAMSRTFNIQVINLGTTTVDEAVASKIPAQLAREKWLFPVEEKSQKLVLAVADPTDQAAINEARTKYEAKSRFQHQVELRLATPKEIVEQIDKHFGPKLVGVLPSGEKIEYLINKPEVEIGKAAHNQIVLTDPTVSNTHAVILSRDGGFNIVDLGSRNGTFVNGEKLTSHARTLKHGDSVQMGQTLWTFRNPSETPENVTAMLSPEALAEVQRRAGLLGGPRNTEPPVVTGSALPGGQSVPTPQAIALPVEVTNIPGQAVAGGVAAPATVNGADDDTDKKKKKKEKSKDFERERIKAAYIRAIGGILATVLSVVLTVLLTIYINHSMRQASAPPTTPTNPPANDITKKGNTKFTLVNPSPGTPFEGGKFEASGAVQVPNMDGIFFVDNSKPQQIFFMPVDSGGRQSGPVQAINYGGSIADPEGIAYGGGFLYVMGSLSFPEEGDKNALVRFAINPQTRELQGTLEVMTGIREFLIANVPELSAVANLNYDRGGINVEGMAWDPVQERLVVGFRSPLVNGNALLVPLRLKDPRGPFTTQNLALQESPMQIPLGNLGIRDISFDTRASAYIIIAGSIAQGEAKEFVLYEWTGEADSSKPDSAPKELARLDAKMKPEGATRVRVGGRDVLLVVGDSSSYSKFDIVEGQ